MAQDIAALLKEYAELRQSLDSLAYLTGIEAACAEGFIDCYDALKVKWVRCEEKMPDTSRYVDTDTTTG